MHVSVASEVGRDRLAALPLSARSQITGLSVLGNEALEVLEPKLLPALVDLQLALDDPFGAELGRQIAKFDLQHLDLSHCGIGAKGLSALTHLPLRTLRLFFDQMGKAAKELRAFEQLTELSLAACDLTAGVVEAVASLPRIRVLSLARNDTLVGPCVQPLTKMKDLQRLDLTETPIGDAGLATLSPLDRLEEIRLHRARLTSKAAKCFESLTSLRTLDLSGNPVGAAMVKSLTTLSRLTVLDLTGCELARPAVEGLAALASLRSLDLSNNDIKAPAVESLQGLRLRKLSVNNSMLGDKGAQTLSKMSSLERLSLTDGDLGPKGMLALGKLTSLRALDVMNNDFGVAGAATIDGLALEEFSASCALGDQAAEALGRMKGLCLLRARQGALGPKGAASLAHAPLVSLDLSGSEIGDLGAASLAAVSTLRSLRLDGNGIGPKGVAALAKLPLRELSLAENPIGAGVRELESMSTLEDLDLTDVRVDKAGRARLAKALPGCLLEFG